MKLWKNPALPLLLISGEALGEAWQDASFFLGKWIVFRTQKELLGFPILPALELLQPWLFAAALFATSFYKEKEIKRTMKNLQYPWFTFERLLQNKAEVLAFDLSQVHGPSVMVSTLPGLSANSPSDTPYTYLVPSPTHVFHYACTNLIPGRTRKRMALHLLRELYVKQSISTPPAVERVARLLTL